MRAQFDSCSSKGMKFGSAIESLNYKLSLIENFLNKSLEEESYSVVKATEESESNSTGTSTTTSRVPAKDDCSLLLKEPDPDFTFTPSSASNHSGRKRRTRKKSKRIIDPLRPTQKRSFGVDIGQGINVIKYLKENFKSPNDVKERRLYEVFGCTIPIHFREESWDEFYKLGALSREVSSSNRKIKSNQKMGAHESLTEPKGVQFEYDSDSEVDMYRIRYKPIALDIPNDYGVDYLQSLFEPNRVED